MPKHNPELESHHTLVAQWETTGKRWLALYKYQSEKFGTVYSYKGHNLGGGLELDIKTDADAIAEMERGWGQNGKHGAGAAFVMKLDNVSLKRVV